nr:hypothetical protein [Tanacetum cinerariifolium]
DDIEAIENVIEDKPYFFMKVIDNDLSALTMLVKHFMNEHMERLLGPRGRSCGGNGGRGGSMAIRGGG